MAKITKRIIACFLVFALVLTLAPATATQAATRKPKKMTLNMKSKTIYVGDKVTIKVKKVSPSKASKAVTYKSSKKSVATVSKKGYVTGKKAGTAYITVTSKKNKKLKKKVKITVKKKTEYSKVQVWLPMPKTDDNQKISNVKWDFPNATTVKETTDANGNDALYIEWDKYVAPEKRTGSASFDFERKEVKAVDISASTATDVTGMDAYLGTFQTGGSLTEGIVKETADMIVANAGAKTIAQKAEAIYDWEVRNLYRLDGVYEGCGQGQVPEILQNWKDGNKDAAGGHCTDLNSTYVALCRAVGVPAREMFGLRANDDATGGQHCRAQFFLPDMGENGAWIEADPADTLKAVRGSEKGGHVDASEEQLATLKPQYWTANNENWVMFNMDRDLTLSPAQAGKGGCSILNKDGSLNNFGYPYAEIDGISGYTYQPAKFVYAYATTGAKTEEIDGVKVKSGTITCTLDMSAGNVVDYSVAQLWLPMPSDDANQTITNVKADVPNATKVEETTDANGNKAMYIEWNGSVEPAKRTGSVSFDFDRKAVKAVDISGSTAEEVTGMDAYLGTFQTGGSLTEGIVKETADMIVANAGAKTIAQKAEAIYDWEVRNLYRLDGVYEGCGQGQVPEILQNWKDGNKDKAGGHCTDLNSTYVALCRAVGVPAREMFGLRANADATGGQHCRAQFYLPDVNGGAWIEADPADTLKAVRGSEKGGHVDATEDQLAELKTQFWTTNNENWVMFNMDRDLTLSPAQAGKGGCSILNKDGTLNNFGYPYAEINGISGYTYQPAKFVYTYATTNIGGTAGESKSGTITCNFDLSAGNVVK